MRLLRYLLVGIGLFVAAFLCIAVDFALRSRVVDRFEPLTSTAIVFTGQYDRIEHALLLLNKAEIDRIFISGVNPKAGLSIANFANQFALTAEQRLGLGLGTGQITLAPDANTTLENALETLCWLDRQPNLNSVVLITSQRHMARASLALERAIGPIKVIRVASDPVEAHIAPWKNRIEMRKFFATWGLSLLPTPLWPANTPTNCAQN